MLPQQREAELFGYAPTPPRGALQWVGAEGHPRQQRLARPAPADREPCPSFLHRSPAPHRPRHGTALSYHETCLTWSPLQPSIETLRYWDLQLVSDADERRSRVDEDVDRVRAHSRPFGLGAREGGAGEPSPVEASGAVLAQCVSRARVRRSLRPVRESPAAPFLACLSAPPPACERCSSSSPLTTSYCTSDGAAPAGPPNTRPTDSSSNLCWALVLVVRSAIPNSSRCSCIPKSSRAPCAPSGARVLLR